MKKQSSRLPKGRPEVQDVQEAQSQDSVIEPKPEVEKPKRSRRKKEEG